MTGCTPCQGDLTTEYPGVTSAERCVCPDATYRNLGGKCVACPTSMTCGLGSAQALFQHHLGQPAKSFEQAPTVNAGFYSRSDATLSIYLCAPVYVCKGGVYGSEGDAGDRRNFMCSECPDDYVLSTGDLEDDPSASDCRKCEAVNWLFLILLPLIGLVALLAVLADAKHSPLDNSGG